MLEAEEDYDSDPDSLALDGDLKSLSLPPALSHAKEAAEAGSISSRHTLRLPSSVKQNDESGSTDQKQHLEEADGLEEDIVRTSLNIRDKSTVQSKVDTSLPSSVENPPSIQSNEESMETGSSKFFDQKSKKNKLRFPNPFKKDKSKRVRVKNGSDKQGNVQNIELKGSLGGKVNIINSCHIQVGNGHVMNVDSQNRDPRVRNIKETKKRLQDFRITDSTRILSSKDIQILAYNLGNSWRDVGERLGLVDGALDIVEHDNAGDLKEKITQMFNLWKQKYGDKATVNRVVKVLKNLKLQGVAAELPADADS